MNEEWDAMIKEKDVGIIPDRSKVGRRRFLYAAFLSALVLCGCGGHSESVETRLEKVERKLDTLIQNLDFLYAEREIEFRPAPFEIDSRLEEYKDGELVPKLLPGGGVTLSCWSGKKPIQPDSVKTMVCVGLYRDVLGDSGKAILFWALPDFGVASLSPITIPKDWRWIKLSFVSGSDVITPDREFMLFAVYHQKGAWLGTDTVPPGLITKEAEETLIKGYYHSYVEKIKCRGKFQGPLKVWDQERV